MTTIGVVFSYLNHDHDLGDVFQSQQWPRCLGDVFQSHLVTTTANFMGISAACSDGQHDLARFSCLVDDNTLALYPQPYTHEILVINAWTGRRWRGVRV